MGWELRRGRGGRGRGKEENKHDIIGSRKPEETEIYRGNTPKQQHKIKSRDLNVS